MLTIPFFAFIIDSSRSISFGKYQRFGIWRPIVVYAYRYILLREKIDSNSSYPMLCSQYVLPISNAHKKTFFLIYLFFFLLLSLTFYANKNKYLKYSFMCQLPNDLSLRLGVAENNHFKMTNNIFQKTKITFSMFTKKIHMSLLLDNYSNMYIFF